MHRAWLVIGWALLAACPSSEGTHVRVRAFAAPPAEATAGFVAIHHPWSVEAAGTAIGHGAFAVLAPLEDVAVTCANPACHPRSEQSILIEHMPATGVEIVVAKPGFESVTLAIPTARGAYTYIVLLHPVSP